MPTLLELQEAMGRALVGRADGEVARYVVANGFTPAELLNVHRNNFAGALTAALRLSFPAVHGLVGAGFFESAAQIFIDEKPPRSPYLNEYGAAFSSFLAGFPPARSVPYLAEVVGLEWAVSRALHAPDKTPLDLARLAEVDSRDHGRIRFVAHPSVSLIHAINPVDSIWRAVLDGDDAALSAIDLTAGPVWLIVERPATFVEVQRMTEAQWRFANDLCAGHALQQILGSHDGIDPSRSLADHLTAGRFIDFSVTDSVVIGQGEEQGRIPISC